MATLYDAKGNEVEALTADEVAAQKAELETTHQAALKEKEDAAAAALAEVNAKLEEAGLSDAQKKRLKEQKEIAEVALKEMTENFGKQIKDLEARLFGGQKTKLINAVTGDDETRQKVSAKVETLLKSGDYANDEEGIARAVADAATIITGARPQPGFMDNISGSGARGNVQTHGANQPETDGAKAQRKLLGISDEDAAKYGPK